MALRTSKGAPTLWSRRHQGGVRGGKPGPVVALRADLDALPVADRNELPFRSQAKGEWLGKEVPVSHACGHDTHVAICWAPRRCIALRGSPWSAQPFGGVRDRRIQPAGGVRALVGSTLSYMDRPADAAKMP